MAALKLSLSDIVERDNIPDALMSLAARKISSEPPVSIVISEMLSRLKREMSVWPFCASDITTPS